jgi:hypothetical protein
MELHFDGYIKQLNPDDLDLILKVIKMNDNLKEKIRTELWDEHNGYIEGESVEYIIKYYERFNNHKGEILSINKEQNGCEDIKVGDTLVLDVGRYEVMEVEHFKAFDGGTGQNVLILIKLITINDGERN